MGEARVSQGVRVSWGSGESGVLARRDLRIASLLQVRSLPRMSISGESVGVLKLRSGRGLASTAAQPAPAALRLYAVFTRGSAASRLASVLPRLASAALRLDARIGGSSRLLFQSSFFFAPNRPATKEETIAVMIAPKRQDRKPPVEKGKPSCVDSQPVNLKRTEFVTIAKSPKLNR